MKVEIVTRRRGKEAGVEYDYQPRDEDEKPMILDVLLQAQVEEIPIWVPGTKLRGVYGGCKRATPGRLQGTN